MAAYPNRAQLIHPLLRLSTTLKERAVVCFGRSAYLNDQLFFGSLVAGSLAHRDFHSKLFIGAQGFHSPFEPASPILSPASPSNYLGLFTRLSLLEDAGFYLFLSLNLK